MLKFFTPVIVLVVPTSVSADDISNIGKQLYTENCASCHGVSLEGQENWRIKNDDGTMPAPPHNETGHTWHHDDELLFSYTKLGGAELLKQRGVTNFKSGMPGFKDTMTDEEIVAVIAYIKSTWPEEIQKGQSQRSKSKDN